MDSSSDAATAERRKCPKCAKLSSLNYDQHSFCHNCRGNDCDESSKCDECSAWPADVFDRYIK